MALQDNIAKQFELLEKNLNGQKGGVLHNIRKEAFAVFQQLGLPGMRHEEWKYTNIKTRLPETLTLTGGAVSNVSKFHSFPNIKTTKLVFVDGIFVKELSTIIEEAGVITGNLKNHLQTDKELVEKYYSHIVKNYEEHFSSLNTAFAADGCFICIKKGVEAKHPIFVIHLSGSTENFTQSRDLIIAEENSSADIIIDFQNLASSAFYNHVSEVFVEKNASIDITKLQTETTNATAVHTLEADASRDSKFSCTTISFEGALLRNNTNVRLSGENTEVHLNGLYYGKGSSLIDNHILVDHRVPNCQSNQLYKGILDDEATGVFNGKIFVRQDAQKTNSYQSSKAILLSDEASVNSKPQLEIFADDVKCSHGAAIGQLNDDEVFYLRARGIEEENARAMLTHAFAAAIIEKIKLPELQEYVDAKLRARLGLEK